MTVAKNSRPAVHGSARQISTDTGVGNADSDGPKSPSATRFQNTAYCCSRPPCRPYSSRSDWRISAIASGLVLPKVVAGGDRLLHRIDRRGVRDEEGDVDADEHDQHELAEPAQQVGRIRNPLGHLVMAGLVPAIHVFLTCIGHKTWMAGPSPAMTVEDAGAVPPYWRGFSLTIM